MSKITLEQIETFMENNKPPETIELDYGDFKVNMRTSLTIAEKLSFIENVVGDSYINTINPSELLADVLFSVYFLKHCTDVSLPLKEEAGDMVVDIQKSYDIAVALKLADPCSDKALTKFDWIYQLRSYISDRMDFENAKTIAFASQSKASDEAIENVNGLLNKGMDLLDAGLNKLETLTPDKVNDFTTQLIGAMATSMMVNREVIDNE